MTASPSTADPACDPPLVSVVMPVRNEAAFIERSLDAVLAQDHPADRLEILVVDGDSSDGTADLVRQRGGGRVRIIANPDRTAAAAMNRGIAAARGDVIVRVDGHAEIGPSHVSHVLADLASHDVDAVGGPLVTVGHSLTGRALALAMSSRLGVGGSRFRVGATRAGDVDTVPFAAYTRRAWRRAGMFDETFVRNQDDEFHLRLTRSGGRIRLLPALVCTYHARERLRDAWRQFFGYGYWKTAVLRKHGGLPAWRAYAPPLFVLALVAALAGSAATASWAPLAILVLPYALLLVAWTLTIGARRDVIGAQAAPFAFATLHLAYGCGFLVGLARGPRPKRVAPGRIEDLA